MPTVLGGTWSFFSIESVCLVDYILNFL